MKSINTSEIVAANQFGDLDFYFTTQERRYEFTTLQKVECVQWSRLFSIIVKMNKKGISCEDKNPFDFEAEYILNKGHETDRENSKTNFMPPATVINQNVTY